MPSRYDENTKARAVRLVREHRDDYDGEWAAMKAISARLGMNTETLRKRFARPKSTPVRRPGSPPMPPARSASCAANAASSNRRSKSSKAAFLRAGVTVSAKSHFTSSAVV